MLRRALPVALALGLAAFPALGVRRGKPSPERSVVYLLRGDRGIGSAVLLDRRVLLTASHVLPATDPTPFTFTWAADARDPSKIPPAMRARLAAIRVSGNLRTAGIPDGLALALVERADRDRLDGISFPTLPAEGAEPGKGDDPLTLIGYGVTGREGSGQTPTVGMRNEGTVAYVPRMPDTDSFATQSTPADHYARGLDSGAPVFKGRTLVGITSMIDGRPDLPLSARPRPGVISSHIWLASPPVRRWIDSVLREWANR
jgi:hypothetical protein